ncbi:VOC family protein [uncultured Victivallis sp.]|uniref:VOC family protein n=1 Tax=uncultured Victivallis sp. TaxID=354118 RepID=UPI00258FAB7A|nr:VOC family protein [uncultured Victivallis sp.]
MVTGIAHICIRTRDLAAARRFYCEGLGCKPGFEFLRDGQLVGFYLKLGGQNFLEFFKADGQQPPAENCSFGHLCLEVDSIEETAETLKAVGAEVTARTMGKDHSYQAWTTAPDGIRIELHEYTARSCQRTGAACILD